MDLYGRVALGVELVPGSKETGGNGHILFAKLAEALGMQPGEKQPHRPAVKKNVRTSDTNLDRAYSALLNFEWFALSEEHHANLVKRGMDDVTINRNGYRSISSECKWVDQFPEEKEEYWQLGIEKVASEYPSLARQSMYQRIGGFIAARMVEKQGIPLQGVPGFYRLKGRWLFRLEPGMLIPTRNLYGQVVGMQARKDEGTLRYMTISSKHLPDGVTEGISRIHFPLSNAPLTSSAKVLITEGPIKADVTACLMDDPNVLLVALQGVQNTSELPSFLKAAKTVGVTEAFNCFDMDKTTNPHVAAASRAMRQMAQAYGIDVRMKLWDIDFARSKWMELYGLCLYNKFQCPDMKKNVFLEVGKMATLLNEHGVKHSHYFTKGGIVKKYWSDQTKGIDDFLYREKMLSETACCKTEL